MEINSSQLWKERFHHFLSAFLRYMRLIGNSGLIFSFVMLVIFGSYYYSALIEEIPESFPVFFCIAVGMTLVISNVHVRTFLKKADVVFLLACEERLRQYFSLALIYNVIIQAAVTVVIAIIFAPLYAAFANESSYSYLSIIVLCLLSKAWHVLVYWHSLHIHDRRALVFANLLRIFATFLFIYFALTGASIVYVLAVAMIKLIYFGYIAKVHSRQRQLNWLRLLEMEEMLTMRFLKFVHAFVDVPQLARRVKSRKWANVLTAFLRHEKRHAAYFLYLKAFFRSGEYFGIYGRLFIIGLLIIVFIPYQFGKIAFAFLFVYMTAVQMFPLYHHFSDKDAIKLYPLPQQTFAQHFLRMFAGILGVEAMMFAIGFMIDGVSVLYALIWFISAIMFVYAYARQALKKSHADS